VPRPQESQHSQHSQQSRETATARIGHDADRLILVTGATGQQGGAVLRHLRRQGFAVRALTRDVHSPAASTLATTGVGVIQGDFDDRASLARALAGMYGAYAVQTPFQHGGVEGELRQGLAFADAANAAGIQHLVYSSVGSAERQTGIPHFESKYQIEEHIRALGLPHTILRPVFLMENFLASRDTILGGTLAEPLMPATPLQMVAVDDIGAFAALAFATPEQWLGRAIELAGDELTMPQAAACFGWVLGRPVQYVQVPMAEVRRTMDEDQATMIAWFNQVGYSADIPALRALYPALTTLEQWVRRTGWQGAAAGAAGAATPHT
jgi:uncharacterized protein YbjT (DUF2867 family)